MGFDFGNTQKTADRLDQKLTTEADIKKQEKAKAKELRDKATQTADDFPNPPEYAKQAKDKTVSELVADLQKLPHDKRRRINSTYTIDRKECATIELAKRLSGLSGRDLVLMAAAQIIESNDL